MATTTSTDQPSIFALQNLWCCLVKPTLQEQEEDEYYVSSCESASSVTETLSYVEDLNASLDDSHSSMRFSKPPPPPCTLRRCETSELVREHRYRRPSIMQEEIDGSGLQDDDDDLSLASCDSTDSITCGSVSSSSERPATPPRRERFYSTGNMLTSQQLGQGNNNNWSETLQGFRTKPAEEEDLGYGDATPDLGYGVPDLGYGDDHNSTTPARTQSLGYYSSQQKHLYQRRCSVTKFSLQVASAQAEAEMVHEQDRKQRFLERQESIRLTSSDDDDDDFSDCSDYDDDSEDLHCSSSSVTAMAA